MDGDYEADANYAIAVAAVFGAIVLCVPFILGIMVGMQIR